MLSELEFGEAPHIGAKLFTHCAFHGKKVRTRRERQGRLAVGRLARSKLADASARAVSEARKCPWGAGATSPPKGGRKNANFQSINRSATQRKHQNHRKKIQLTP
ncbi:MAG: hypothetical protein COB24_07650 [Hyphomicrobiales bacterium]|nr:MAG: hypothetical protein COB24_07650 [Hyphomicrobiales bacterium]